MNRPLTLFTLPFRYCSWGRAVYNLDLASNAVLWNASIIGWNLWSVESQVWISMGPYMNQCIENISLPEISMLNKNVTIIGRTISNENSKIRFKHWLAFDQNWTSHQSTFGQCLKKKIWQQLTSGLATRNIILMLPKSSNNKMGYNHVPRRISKQKLGRQLYNESPNLNSLTRWVQ